MACVMLCFFYISTSAQRKCSWLACGLFHQTIARQLEQISSFASQFGSLFSFALLLGLNHKAKAAAQTWIKIVVPLVILLELWGRNQLRILLFHWRRPMRRSDFWLNLVSWLIQKLFKFSAPCKSAVHGTQNHCLCRIPDHYVIVLCHSSGQVLLDLYFLRNSEILVIKVLPF